MSDADATSAAGITDFDGETLSNLDTAIKAIGTYRSTLGASINRLNYAADNLQNVSTNTAASRSRIQDTDYAQATMELARTQIIQQAATAMLAQANQQPQTVLSLLRWLTLGQYESLVDYVHQAFDTVDNLILSRET